MAEPISTSQVLSSPKFQERDIDDKFLTLDRLRQNNITYLDEQFSSGQVSEPDEYANKVTHYNGVIRKAKSGLLLNELGTKLTAWAMENDSSPDAARDMLLGNPDRDSLPPGLAELNDWYVKKNKEIEDGLDEAGWSPFNHVSIETDQGASFGSAQMFKDATGKMQAAVNFNTDENGQELPGQEARKSIIPLDDKYDDKLKELDKEIKEKEKIHQEHKAEMDERSKNVPSLLDPGSHGNLMPSAYATIRDVVEEEEREINGLKSTLNRYMDGTRGRSEYFNDQITQKIKSSDSLKVHIPQGGNVFTRVYTEFGSGVAQFGVKTVSGVAMTGHAFTGSESLRETSVDYSRLSEEMGIGRAVLGMGQARNSDAIFDKALVLIADEVPELAASVPIGGLGGLVTKGAIRGIATRAATREVFESAASRTGMAALPPALRDQVVQNATEAYAQSLTRRYGAKVSAAIAALPSGMSDAAGNISIMQDAADNLDKEAAQLEAAGDKEGAEQKKLKARQIEEDMGIAFMSHFGSTAALEFLPLEKLFRRGEKGLTLGENVFAAAERKAKGLTADASETAGVQRAGAAKSAIENFLSSRFGKKTVNAIEQGSTNAITEVLQQISDNKLAQEFYDENRGTFDGVDAAAAGGFFMGTGLGWLASKADPVVVRSLVSKEAAKQDKAKAMAQEGLQQVIGAPIDNQVAEAPENVVLEQDGKYVVMDKDMPEDSGFTNVQFDDREQAVSFAESRWENYGMAKMADILGKTQKEDGTTYTPEEVTSAVQVTRQLVNGVSQGANVSKESTWKALSNSIQFSESDPNVATDANPTDILSGLNTLQEKVGEAEEQGFSPELKKELNEYQDLFNAWNAQPEGERGPQPQIPAQLGIALRAVNGMQEAAATPPTQLNQDSPLGQRIGRLQTNNPYHAKDTEKAQQATKFIGEGSPASSTEKYRQAAGDLANTGNYTPEDKVFVSAEGNRKGRKTPNFQELEKATQAKATIITDDEKNRNRDYNVGEREVAKFLQSKGYTESSPGQWTPSIEQNDTKPVQQETPFQVWQSAVRRRFAPDAAPSDVEVAEIQALRTVFGENAPVNPDGTLDTIAMLEQLSNEATPLGQLAGLLGDILPTMNLSSELLRYRMSPELGAAGIDSPAEQGDVVVGQDDKAASVGPNTTVVQFVNRLASDALGTTLNNYVATVKASIQSRPAMLAQRAAGMMGSTFSGGRFAAENTPSAMEARVAFETALPFGVVKQSPTGPRAGVRNMQDMKTGFIMSELAEVMGGLPPAAMAEAVANNEHGYGATPPGPNSRGNFYIQTPADGRAVAWSNDGSGWRKVMLGKVTQQNSFDTGWESRMARLYLRSVVASGFFDTLFNPSSGLAGTGLTRTEYRAAHGPDAPAYNLTSMSRFVQAVISDPVFANRVGKSMRGFPGINVKDQVFSDVVNNALGAKTQEPDPAKRWLMAQALKMGQAPTVAGIPGNSPQWGPQTTTGDVETAMGPGSVDSRRTPGPRLAQSLTEPGLASSVASPEQVGERRSAAQNYSVSFQGSRQDATGVDPQGEREVDQIDPTELPLRVDGELAVSPSGRFIGEGENFTEEDGREMYSGASRKPRITGEEFEAMSETDDVSEEEFEELNEESAQTAQDYYTAFEIMAQKAADEAEGTVEGDSQIIAAAINNIDREVSAADVGNEGENTMSVINAFIDSDSTTIDQFNQLLADLEGQISDESLKDLAKMWVENRVPKAEQAVKQSQEYREAKGGKAKAEIYRAAVALVMPKGMTRQQSSRIGAEPILDDSSLPEEWTTEPQPDGKEKVVAVQPDKPMLVGQPVMAVDSNAVLAVTGEDPMAILLDHVRKLPPDELNRAHNMVTELAEHFGLDVGETYDNSEGDIRLPSSNGHGWLTVEKVLSALRASRNPIALVERLGSDIPTVMTALAANPRDLANAHALATSFVDSISQQFGAAGFQVKTSSESVTGNPKVDTPTKTPPSEEGDFVVGVKTKNAGNAIDQSLASEEEASTESDPNQILLEMGPEPGPTQQFINRSSRYNLPNKGGVSTRTYPVGARPFIVVGKKRVAITEDTKWQSLDGKSVRETYDSIASSLGIDLDGPALDSLYTEVWRRALSGQKGRSALKANRKYINEYRKKWGKELPMVSPEVPSSRSMTPAKAIAKLVNTELGNVETLDQNNGVRAGYIDTTNRLITILKSGNPSTLIHETVHWMRLTKTNSGMSMFDAALGQNRPHFMNWATKGGALDPTKNFREVEERIAKGLEQYLRDGNVPGTVTDRGVMAAFKRVATMLKKIYHGLAPLVDLTPEAKRGYEKLFGSAEAAQTRPGSGMKPVTGLPTVATDEETDQLVKDASGFGANIPREMAQEAIQQEKAAPRNLMPVVNDPEDTQYPGDPVTILYATNPGATPSKGSHQYKVNMLRSLYRLGKRAFTKWFTAQGHAPWSAFAETLRGRGLRATIERDMLKIQKRLEEAIEAAAKEAGFLNAQEARFNIHRDLNAYLTEQNPVDKATLFRSLPTDGIKRAAVQARQYVDQLSRHLIRTGTVKGPLAATIQSKIGFYLHRSYEMSRDPIAWKDEMLVGMMRPLYEKALDVISKTRGVTLDEAENVASQIFSSLDKAGKDDPSGRAIDSTILMAVSKEFADIQQAADMLLGLKQDPLQNFTKTVEGMAHLITQHEMLSKILSDGLSKGYIRDGRQPVTAANRHLTSPFFGDREVVTDQEWINNPAAAHMRTILAGKFSTPEFTEWTKEVLAAKDQMTKISRLTANLNALFKTANTVHNWISGLRNVMGATLGVWGQGHTGKYLGKAISLVAQDARKGTMTPSDEALYRELLEHNITESATLAELKDYTRRGFNLEEATNHVMKTKARMLGSSPFSGPVDFSEVGAVSRGWREAWHRTVRNAMKYNEFRKKVYGGTDIVAKIAAYLEEKDNVQRMFPGLTPSQVKDEASRRTHLTMFSFDMLPKAVNEFRTHGLTGTLFGPFVSFPYSMLRIFTNTIGVGATDMTQGMKRGGISDPQFRNGVRRLAGLTAVAWGARMGINVINNMLGWDEEKELSAREMLAPWDREGNLLFVSEAGNKFSVINMSSILPFSYVTDAVSALTGNSADKPKSVPEAIINMGEQLIKPFASEQYIFKALMDTMRNENERGQQLWVNGATEYENVARVVSNFMGPLVFGDVKNLVRLGANPGNIGKYLGAKPNDSMEDYEKAIYALGVKVQTVDLERAFPYDVREWTTEYKLSMSDFYRAAGGSQPVDREQLRSYVKFALQRHKDITEKASQHTYTLIEKFGFDPDRAYEAFEDTSLVGGVAIGGKLSEDQRDAIINREWVGPITMSEQQFNNIVNAAAKAKQPERIQWIEEMITEGLLDVRSGR